MLSQKKIKWLIHDEQMAAKFYSEHGLPQIAKDELRHKKLLLKMIKTK